jgi:hypothetical protein
MTIKRLLGSAPNQVSTNKNLGDMAFQDAEGVNITGGAITGGAINNTPIGATTASTGAFTTLGATGVVTFSAGTAAAPAITTTGDTNTGVFFPAADTIAFSEGGAESMRINSSGNLLVGTTASQGRLTVNTDITAIDASAWYTAGVNGGILNLGNEIGNPARVRSVTPIGRGSSTELALALDTVSASGVITERMRVASTGEVLIGKTTVTANGGVLQVSNGITFPATQVASADVNTLDDYEEGTWTPVLTDGTNNATSDVNTGATYTKIGRMVHVTIYLSLTSLGSVSGNISISGFPFVCRNSQSSRATTVAGYSANLLVTAGQSVGLLLSPNATTALVTLTGGATGSSVMTSTQWTGTGQSFFSFSYPTN